MTSVMAAMMVSAAERQRDPREAVSITVGGITPVIGRVVRAGVIGAIDAPNVSRVIRTPISVPVPNHRSVVPTM